MEDVKATSSDTQKFKFRLRHLSTTPMEDVKAASSDIQKLRKSLDDHIVGHADVKEAFLLGLISKEHMYLEGPPGVAKTMMSEIVSVATSLNYWFYQMHRDTRLNELIGESVIVRTEIPDVGEQIKHDVIKGGILTCELAVLDDISRAPGEALNVLLRILQERKFGSIASEKIPLMSAIATGNPVAEDGYYGDALDPATLDRFTLQLQVNGLISSSDWSNASDVIDLYSGPRTLSDEQHVTKVRRSAVLDASELVPLVIFGQDVKNALLRLLQVLRSDYNCNEDNSLLTDRTFLVKAVTIMKAKAIADGRHVCHLEDLIVIKYMTTFRVPEHIHEQIETIIENVIDEERLKNNTDSSSDSSNNHGDQKHGDDDQ
jgi:MoxR-like ATPase